MNSIHTTVSDDLKEQLDNHIDENPIMSNRSEFVRRAIYEKLQRENGER